MTPSIYPTITSVAKVLALIACAAAAACRTPPLCAETTLPRNTLLSKRFEMARGMLNKGFDAMAVELERGNYAELVWSDPARIPEGTFEPTIGCARRAREVLDLDGLEPRYADDGKRRERLLAHIGLLEWQAGAAAGKREDEDIRKELGVHRQQAERVIGDAMRLPTPLDRLGNFQLAVAVMNAMLLFGETSELRTWYEDARKQLDPEAITWGDLEDDRSEQLFMLDHTVGTFLQVATAAPPWNQVLKMGDALRDRTFETPAARKPAADGVKNCDRWLGGPATATIQQQRRP